MSYTDFFIEQHNEHHKGAILNKEQTYRMLNIIDLEAKISIATIKKDNQQRYKYVKKLNELTQRKQPIILLNQMITLSK